MGEPEQIREIPVVAADARWERPTARSFWNALSDSEREVLAAAGVEDIFRPGSVLCSEGDRSSHVMIIESGWVKVSAGAGPEPGEKIIAVRGQGDIIGEGAALTARARSATVTALDEVTAMVVVAQRFAEFLRDHPRAANVLERQVTERREEDRSRWPPGSPSGPDRRLASLLLDIARRRGGYPHGSAAPFTVPMSQQELADWAGTTADGVSRILRTWRELGIAVSNEGPRRLTIADLDALTALCEDRPGVAQPPAQPAGHWLGTGDEPLNCSILFTDVAGFGNPERNDDDQDVVRTTLYEILRSAFEASGIPWSDCYHEDRGDGVVIVVPPVIATRRLVEPLIPELARRLRQHNRRASDVVRIQLRAALEIGPVARDTEGLTKRAVTVAARMLDAPPLKDRLAASQADLAFAASGHVYDYVIRQCDRDVDPAAFEHIECTVKRTRVSAWIYLAGGAASRAVTPSAAALAGRDG
jgi:CRP-like cAMP-binding protein